MACGQYQQCTRQAFCPLESFKLELLIDGISYLVSLVGANFMLDLLRKVISYRQFQDVHSLHQVTRVSNFVCSIYSVNNNFFPVHAL